MPRLFEHRLRLDKRDRMRIARSSATLFLASHVFLHTKVDAFGSFFRGSMRTTRNLQQPTIFDSSCSLNNLGGRAGSVHRKLTSSGKEIPSLYLHERKRYRCNFRSRSSLWCDASSDGRSPATSEGETNNSVNEKNKKPDSDEYGQRIDADNECPADTTKAQQALKGIAEEAEMEAAEANLPLVKQFDDIMQAITEKAGELFGIASPLSQLATWIENTTNGWGMQYANLTPYTPTQWVGVLFLATNVVYSIAGVFLFQAGGLLERFFAIVMETAGIVSTYYHWGQLHYGPNRDEVKKALLIDYVVAALTIMLFNIEYAKVIGTVLLETNILPNGSNGVSGGGDVFSFISAGMSPEAWQILSKIPLSTHPVLSTVCWMTVIGVGAVANLLLSWKYEYGLPYIIFHGFWHLFSGYASILLGIVQKQISSGLLVL